MTNTQDHTKRASIHTLGCRLNQAETALLAERLAAAGYALVPFGEPADLGIVHTCTVTGEADAKSRKLVRQFIRKNPEAYTAVIGCYAQLGAEQIEAIEGVDLIVGNQEKLKLLDYVARGKNERPLVVRDTMRRGDFTIDTVADTQTRVSMGRHRANLKIQDGCDFMCSYCIIPFARGRSRTRDLDNLLEEARALTAGGTKEIVLTGVNVGTYDSEGHNILEVVERLGDIGVERIRISSIEPATVPEGLLDLMADPAHPLVPYLHIPLQSGSNRILEAMRRTYAAEEYLNFVRLAAARVPDIGIGGDIMVGFPSETEEDFEATCRVFAESPLFYAHVFKYSERPGTASERIAEKVDPKTAAQRSARLHELSAAKRKTFYERHLSQTIDVLFEEQADGLWTGYAGNYIRVAVPSDECLENEIRHVLLREASGDVTHGVLAARYFGSVLPGP